MASIFQCEHCQAAINPGRRRGSLRRFCSSRCRKFAWLSLHQSVPERVGHLAQPKERLGRKTDIAARMIGGTSGRSLRRHLELRKIVTETFGNEEWDKLLAEIKAGTNEYSTHAMLISFKAYQQTLTSTEVVA